MNSLQRVATIGTFDGVHLGHLLVLDTVKKEALCRGMRPAVFAFASHPLEVIAPERVPEKLMDFSAQTEFFNRLEIESFPIHFDEKLRNMTAFDYMRFLRDEYSVAVLVVGYDNRFGKDRESDFDDYQCFARQLGMEVVRAKEMKEVSSSIIRRLLRDGQIVEANKKLGYRYSLTGIVVHGNHLGRTIGFPTINMQLIDSKRLVPANGVYAVEIELTDGTLFGGMLNIGHRPTICDDRICKSIEANIFNFDGDLYGQTITLHFVAFMRNEKKMSSIDALRCQLEDDRQFARQLLEK